MNRLLVLSLAALPGIVPLLAQKKPVPFFVAHHEGKTYLLLADVPAKTKGVHVYRKTEGEFELLTEAPLEPEKDPFTFRDVLGDEYNWIKNATKAENELQVMRRVQSDRGMAFAFSLASSSVARALGRFFIDSTAREGEEYTYRITYLDHSNKEFDQKDRRITTKSVPLVSPYEVKAEAGDGRVKLLWRYAPYTGEPGDVVVGFNIYRAEKDAKTRKVNSTLVLRQEGQLSRVDNEVVNGASYTYTVRAVDFVGRESEPSGTATAVPRDSKPPAAPRGLIAAAQEGQIVVSWNKGPDPDISYYDIYRGLSSQDQFTRVNVRPVPASTPNFVDTGVVFGPYYFYKVKATDMSGNESEFSASIPARPGDNTAPYPPAGVTTSVAGRIVRLQWKGTTSQDVLGYYVYRGLRADNLLRIVSTPLPADSAGHSDGGFGMRGLNPGTTYYYAVSAIDRANNESGRTAAIVKIPDNEAPAPPFDVRASANNYGIIDVGWQPSPSPDVSEFRVYRARNLQPHQRIATVRAFGWRDSAVVRGERYEYRVAAVDSSGNESTMSPPAIAVSSSVYLPPVPSGVRALLSGTTVAITWSPVDPRELLGYNVYRSPRPSGAFEKLNTEVIKVTRYADGSGKAGMYYRVTSVSTSGHENTAGSPVRTEKR